MKSRRDFLIIGHIHGGKSFAMHHPERLKSMLQEVAAHKLKTVIGVDFSDPCNDLAAAIVVTPNGVVQEITAEPLKDILEALARLEKPKFTKEMFLEVAELATIEFEKNARFNDIPDNRPFYKQIAEKGGRKRKGNFYHKNQKRR